MRIGFFALILSCGLALLYIFVFTSEEEIRGDKEKSYGMKIDLVRSVEKDLEVEDLPKKLTPLKTFFPFYLSTLEDRPFLRNAYSSRIQLGDEGLEEKQRSRFILVPPLRETLKSCYSIQSLGSLGFYLVNDYETLKVEAFSSGEEFEKKATFCFTNQKKLSPHSRSFSLENSEDLLLSYDKKEDVFSFSEKEKPDSDMVQSFHMKMMSEGLEGARFLYESILGKSVFYLYKKDKGVFEPESVELPHKNFYQPHELVLKYTSKTGQYDSKDLKPFPLFLKKGDLRLTTKEKGSQPHFFIPVEPLWQTEDESCLSLLVFKKKRFFLTVQDHQVKAVNYQENDDYLKSATFCLEKGLRGTYILYNWDKSLHVDHHTYRDGFFSLVPESPYEPLQTGINFQSRVSKLQKHELLVYIPRMSQAMRYSYDTDWRAFVQDTKNLKKTKKTEFSLEVADSFQKGPFPMLRCAISHSKRKNYYHSNHDQLKDYLVFDIHYNDPKDFNHLVCSFFGYNSLRLRLFCDVKGEKIDLLEACEAKYEIDGKSFSFGKGQWGHLDLVELFNIK